MGIARRLVQVQRECPLGAHRLVLDERELLLLRSARDIEADLLLENGVGAPLVDHRVLDVAGGCVGTSDVARHQQCFRSERFVLHVERSACQIGLNDADGSQACAVWQEHRNECPQRRGNNDKRATHYGRVTSNA